MKKIFPKKYYNIIFASLMASMMSGVMSAFVTFRNVGFVENYLNLWLHAWFGAFLIGLPVALFVVPLVRKFVDKITY